MNASQPLRVAFASDEPYAVHREMKTWMESEGFRVIPFGAVNHGAEVGWVEVAQQASFALANGSADAGVFCCWSGTGICIAANKHKGIRAALCGDPETARASRVWNHANVLCLSNRLLSVDLGKEILAAWFRTPWDAKGEDAVRALSGLEQEA